MMTLKTMKKFIFWILILIGLIFAIITLYKYIFEKNLDVGGATFALLFLLSPIAKEMKLPLGGGLNLK